MALRKISVLGCGWLGLPLAEHLVSKGYKVKGSTTTQSKLPMLGDKDIDPYWLNLTPIIQARDLEGFLSSELIIINIPPGTRTRSARFHVEQMQHLKSHLEKSPSKYIIYVSSTAVYPERNREVKEPDVSSIEDAANQTLFQAEEIIRSVQGKQSTILRCGGLTGYDRLLIRHFAGRKGLLMGEEHVNLIHRDDVIGIIAAIIEKQAWGEVFNICSPEHPLKKDFYSDLAARFGYEQPEFVKPEKTSFKIVNTNKLTRVLGYSFKYPDPMTYDYTV